MLTAKITFEFVNAAAAVVAAVAVAAALLQKLFKNYDSSNDWELANERACKKPNKLS